MFEKGQGLRPRKFAIGNYVVLNDGNSTTIEGSRQLNFPGSKELYKIIQINKEGFSLTLLNIRTLAQLTVLHSRVSHLHIDEIINYDLDMPQLYEKLAELNVRRCNTFIPGKSNQPLKLLNEERTSLMMVWRTLMMMDWELKTLAMRSHRKQGSERMI